MQDYEPDTTILIAPDEPTLLNYRRLLADKGIRIHRSRCFTLRTPHTLEGLLVKKVLVARADQIQYPGAHAGSMQMIIRLLARSKDREGFFALDEEGNVLPSTWPEGTRSGSPEAV